MYKVYNQMKYYTTKKPEELKEALESDNYALTLKKDGASYVLAIDEDGSVHLYGDKISKKTGAIIDKIDNVQFLKEWAMRNMPRASQLVGEIYIQGGTSRDTNTIMLALPALAAQRQEIVMVNFYIFDILFWNEEEVWKKDYQDRYNLLKKLQEELEPNSQVEFVDNVVVNKTNILHEWLAAGEEGGVLKLLRSVGKRNASYHVREIGQTAARPAHVSYKIKQIDTVDVIITGIEMPTKEYTGKNPEEHLYKDEDDNPINRLWALGYANAFEISSRDNDGQYVKIGTVASGLTDEIRKDAVEHPENYLYKVVEIECMSKENGKLRHPRFICLRPDKEPTDCYLTDLF